MHMGKRPLLAYDNRTCLLVEGMGFEIVDDSSWKKPDRIKREIGSHYLKFYTERGCEPHYADYVIRWLNNIGNRRGTNCNRNGFRYGDG